MNNKDGKYTLESITELYKDIKKDWYYIYLSKDLFNVICLSCDHIGLQSFLRFMTNTNKCIDLSQVSIKKLAEIEIQPVFEYGKIVRLINGDKTIEWNEINNLPRNANSAISFVRNYINGKNFFPNHKGSLDFVQGLLPEACIKYGIDEKVLFQEASKEIDL